MKTAVAYPDAERLVVDVLTELAADIGYVAGVNPPPTVGVNLPGGWTPAARPHLQVALDFTDTRRHPIVARCTIRVTAWAGSTTLAKELADLAHGLLIAAERADLPAVQPLTGPLPATDPSNRGDLASFTVRVSVRSEPIETA